MKCGCKTIRQHLWYLALRTATGWKVGILIEDGKPRHIVWLMKKAGQFCEY